VGGGAGVGAAGAGQGGRMGGAVVMTRDGVHVGGGRGQQMIQVPDGHCWMEGDNLPWSKDSRDYGPVPLGLIKGKVVARIQPFRSAKWIRNAFDEVD
jgi:hypothetical protein